MQRGTVPRVYRNTLIFIAAEARQLDSLKEAVRAALGWDQVARESDNGRLDLKTSDITMAKDKQREARETMRTRLQECWSYLLYPHQDSAHADFEWSSGKIPAQDGLLSRASRKLVSDEALLPELGPTRLDRDLQKYIWNGKPHLQLKDLWEYLNRYLYLPRIKNQQVLVKAVQAAVTGIVAGPFAYADSWNEASDSYSGLLVESARDPHVIISAESVILKPDVAEAHRPVAKTDQTGVASSDTSDGTAAEDGSSATKEGIEGDGEAEEHKEHKPTRFLGTVMISADRPARDIHQIVEAIVEQLTTIPGSDVTLKLEIDAEVSQGLDRSKVRTLLENATTLGFLDKIVR